MVLSFLTSLFIHDIVVIDTTEKEVVMDNLKTKEEEKKELTEQILNLKDMRRGSVTEQYYEVKHKDGTVIRQGPYFLYSYKEKGKTISRRLSGPGEAERFREEIEVFRRFEQLSARLVEVSHGLCDLKTRAGKAPAKPEDKKKLRRRSSRRSSGKSSS